MPKSYLTTNRKNGDLMRTEANTLLLVTLCGKKTSFG